MLFLSHGTSAHHTPPFYDCLIFWVTANRYYPVPAVILEIFRLGQNGIVGNQRGGKAGNRLLLDVRIGGGGATPALNHDQDLKKTGTNGQCILGPICILILGGIVKTSKHWVNLRHPRKCTIEF